jgi:hypothetical protein
MPGRILCYVLMIIQWVVIYQSEQNDHRRDQCACVLYVCYARPSVGLWLHLLWTLCLLPSAFYELHNVFFFLYIYAYSLTEGHNDKRAEKVSDNILIREFFV